MCTKSFLFIRKMNFEICTKLSILIIRLIIILENCYTRFESNFENEHATLYSFGSNEVLGK